MEFYHPTKLLNSWGRLLCHEAFAKSGAFNLQKKSRFGEKTRTTRELVIDPQVMNTRLAKRRKVYYRTKRIRIRRAIYLRNGEAVDPMLRGYFRKL